MQNLAGKKDCDTFIERELVRCGIEVVLNQPRDGEVASSLRGQLGAFQFKRAWRYWMVEGDVPLSVARELYNDPVGKEDIRVSGHCGCPAPDDGHWAIWKAEDGRVVVATDHEAKLRELVGNGTLPEAVLSEYVFSDDPKSMGAKAYITSYHIDSEVGLRIFADTLKKHQLA